MKVSFCLEGGGDGLQELPKKAIQDPLWLEPMRSGLPVAKRVRREHVENRLHKEGYMQPTSLRGSQTYLERAIPTDKRLIQSPYLFSLWYGHPPSEKQTENQIYFRQAANRC